MAKDLEIIKWLEKKYGTELEKLKSEDVMKWRSPNGYAVDEKKDITGLNKGELLGLWRPGDHARYPPFFFIQAEPLYTGNGLPKR